MSKDRMKDVIVVGTFSMAYDPTDFKDGGPTDEEVIQFNLDDYRIEDLEWTPVFSQDYVCGAVKFSNKGAYNPDE